VLKLDVDGHGTFERTVSDGGLKLPRDF